MRTIVKLLFFCTMIVLTALLFFSCDLMNKATGSLTIDIEDDRAVRIILPAADALEAASFTVTGEGPGGQSFCEEATSAPITIDDLAEGAWSVTVDGYNGEGTQIGSRTMDVMINSGENTQATFGLEFLTGEGDLLLDVIWPETIGEVSEVREVLVPLVSGSAECRFSFAAGDAAVEGGTATLQTRISELHTGSYDLTVTFLDTEGASLAECTDTVTVYKDMTSTGTVEVPEDIAEPTFTPGPGTYDVGLGVEISCSTSDVTIYYTTDGSDPTVSDSVYSAPVSVTENTILKAIAVKDDGTSDIAEAEYSIRAGVPSFSPGAGTYADSQDVTLTSATDGAFIYYTTDGSDPDPAVSSYVLIGGTVVISSSCTLKAVSVRSNMENSDVVSAEYTIGRAIGSTGPAGGIIFYDDEADGVDDILDCRYLEAAPSGWYGGGVDPKFQWGAWESYTVDPPATATAIGSGKTNTEHIVDYHDNLGTLYPDKGDYYTNPTAYYVANDGTVAAKICSDIVINGYDDWFLPSKDELNLMYVNLKEQGLGGFVDNMYWSSSEWSAQYAWLQYFSNGAQYYARKYYAYCVRPVRAFSDD